MQLTRTTLNPMLLARLNSATKYPSIPTYHDLGPGGLLTEERSAMKDCTGPVILTEKVDGTNARIVVLPGGSTYLFGSREEFLYVQGDVLHVPMMGIVETLALLGVERCLNDLNSFGNSTIAVIYGEVYGYKIGQHARWYARGEETGFRVFDVGLVSTRVLEREPRDIASWRDAGGQQFLDEQVLTNLCSYHGLPLVPRLKTLDASALPRTLEEARLFVQVFASLTMCRLDVPDLAPAEGIVLRSPNRRWIAKLRAEDYERALRRKEK